MQIDVRSTMLQDARERYLAGQMSRRKVIGLLGALGLTAAAAPWLRREATANEAPAPGGHSLMAGMQEGTPAAGPPPAPTPALGPQADGSTTWKVMAGGFNEELGAEYSVFLPETITINAGDKIYYEVGGFHNVAFGAGADPVPLFIPDPAGGAPVATPPAAGAGQPQLIFNPQILFPAGNGSVEGSGYVNSGIAIDPTAPPIVFTFPTAGTFDYICLIHPMFMKGQVVVQEAGSALPKDQAAYDAETQQKLSEFDSKAGALAGTGAASPAADGATTHDVAIGPGEANGELLRYILQDLTVKAGDTVRWTWKGSMTPHTVTFLGGEAPIEDIIFGQGADGAPKASLNPNSFYPSDPQGTYSGQGIVNSGYMGVLPQLPTTFELTFDTEGEYKYYCILHAGSPDDPPTQAMVGKVTVEAAS